MRQPLTTYVPSRQGVEVAAHDYGGDGRPLLFLHGTGLCSRTWEPVMARLPLDAVRPIAVDLRGHGASRTPGAVTFADHDMVADLSAVAAHFGLVGAWAAAHSMGGGTAILAEAAQPGTFERLWVFEPIVFPRPLDGGEGPSALVEATRRRRPVYPSRQAAAERYGSRPPLDELHPEVLHAYVAHGFVDQPDGSVRLACEPEVEARAYEEFLSDGFERLGGVRAPVLVGYGDRSTDPSGEWAPKVAEALPAGVTERFTGSAHFGPFADLDATAASLRRWFLGDGPAERPAR